MAKPVIIINANGIGKAAQEIFAGNNVVIYGFLDDNKALHGTEIADVSVLGATNDPSYIGLIGKDCDVFVASDDTRWKTDMIKSLQKSKKAIPINAIHKIAHIASSAVLHHGSFINQNVQVGAHAVIGNHCNIQSGAIIDFAARLGDYVQIGAGSVVNSEVSIGNGAFIGSGATIVSGVTIGDGARIGAGSVVITDVAENETVFGNPATPVGEK
jgi:sugar O-acyltransferase (sialic acid O-acetyltransferase NeuD family)